MARPETTARFDSDLDGQSPAADLVRVYLTHIGKRKLLKPEQERDIRTGLGSATPPPSA